MGHRLCFVSASRIMVHGWVHQERKVHQLDDWYRTWAEKWDRTNQNAKGLYWVCTLFGLLWVAQDQVRTDTTCTSDIVVSLLFSYNWQIGGGHAIVPYRLLFHTCVMRFESVFRAPCFWLVGRFVSFTVLLQGSCFNLHNTGGLFCSWSRHAAPRTFA